MTIIESKFYSQSMADHAKITLPKNLKVKVSTVAAGKGLVAIEKISQGELILLELPAALVVKPTEYYDA